MTTERQEANRKLAEWLEPEPKWKFADAEHEDIGICWMQSDGGAYRRMYNDGRVELEEPPDFCTDEAASALLLEKLPEVGLHRDGDQWAIGIVWNRCDWMRFSDRKTAVFEAALKYLEGQT